MGAVIVLESVRCAEVISPASETLIFTFERWVDGDGLSYIKGRTVLCR